jgi:predicted MFS family arabinose efflux permease
MSLTPLSSPVSSPSSISQSSAVASLAALYIFRMLGLFMVLPVLSLSGGEYLGSTGFLLGVALGIYALTQACLQIPFGLLSDRFGRKPLIFIGFILFAMGSIVAATADTVLGLILGRALQGAGAIAGVIMAMVGDLTSPENRTKAMASIGASIGIAFALALVLGPLISSLHIGSLTGIRLLFWSATLLAFIGMIILLWCVPSVASVQQKVSQLSFAHLRSVMDKPQCLLLYGGIFVLHYVLMAFFVVVPLLLEQALVPRESHSWIYLGAMLVSFMVMVPLMIIGEKRQAVKPILLSTIAGLIAVLLLISVAYHQLNLLILGLGAFFIAFNYLEANLPSLLTKTLAAESKGAGSGVFATCQFLGAALGGIVGGGLYDHWGLVATFISAIVLLVLWLWAAQAMVIPSRKGNI